MEVDDKLLEGSNRLVNFKDDTVDKTLKSFSVIEDSGIQLFADKLDLLNQMHNENLRIMFDDENIYLPI